MSYTIEEHEANMTVYYSKNTGEIKGLCTGIQDMNYFGIDAVDFSTIWSYVKLPKDAYVLENPNKFILDLSGIEPVLSLKQESVNQYPVASQ